MPAIPHKAKACEFCDAAAGDDHSIGCPKAGRSQPTVERPQPASTMTAPGVSFTQEATAADKIERARNMGRTDMLASFEKLIIAAQCALACLDQPACHPGDVDAARKHLAHALYVPEPTRPVNMLPELRRAAAAVVEEAGKDGRVVSPVIARAVDVLRQRLGDHPATLQPADIGVVAVTVEKLVDEAAPSVAIIFQGKSGPRRIGSMFRVPDSMDDVQRIADLLLRGAGLSAEKISKASVNGKTCIICHA